MPNDYLVLIIFTYFFGVNNIIWVIRPKMGFMPPLGGHGKVGPTRLGDGPTGPG